MADIKVAIYLKNGEKVEFGKRYIQNLESLSQSNADPSSIFYGVLASTGSIQILDINGQIEGYIKDNLLDTTSITVELYLNGKLIHSHISSDNSYDNVGRMLNLQLSDKLSKWDNINFNGYDYPEQQQTAYEMLKNILTSLGYDENYINNTMLSEYTANSNNASTTIKEYLDSITIQYPYLPAGSLHETIDKFCTLAQLNVILDNNNDIKFVNARPIKIANSIIEIPRSKQYSKLNYTLVTKNKYDSVELNEFKVLINETATENAFSYTKQLNGDDYNYTYSYFDYAKGNGAFSNAKIETFYSNEFDFNMPKLSNHNLKKILSVVSTQDVESTEIKATVNVSGEYGVYEGSYEQTLLNDATPGDNTSYFAQNPYYNNIKFNNTPSRVTSKPLTELESNFGIEGGGGFPKVEIKDSSYVNILDEGEYYHCNARILDSTIGYLVMHEPRAGKEYLNANISKYKTNSLIITFQGVVREITFNNVVSDYKLKSNPVSINGSELFEQVTTINDKKMSDIVKDNILLDYSNGLSDATLTVSCANYYDEVGQRVVDFNKGELLQVGDVVKVQGNDKTWEITGRKFSYAGCPFVDLELMEIKRIIRPKTKISIDTSLSGSNHIEFNIDKGEELIVDFGDGNTLSVSSVVSGFVHDYDFPFKGVITISGNLKSIEPNDNNTRLDILSVIMGDTIIKSGTYWGIYERSNCKTFTLSNNMTEIEARAFPNLLKVKEIIIPDSVTNIGVGAFSSCRSLISLSIPDSVTVIPNTMCLYCSSLQNITFGENVTEIGDSAFESCEKLTYFKVPKTVSNFGLDVFRGTNLSKLVIDSTIVANDSRLTRPAKEVYVLSSITLEATSFINRWYTFARREGAYNIYNY